MTAAPAIKGWCPTLLSPMQSGDGWLARVKPSAVTLSAGAARFIAATARRHGNGHIDLTSRANLQVRGLSPRSAELFADTIIAAGLASANPSHEAIRNVMASPLGPDDPTAAFDSLALAREIEAMLAQEPALAAAFYRSPAPRLTLQSARKGGFSPYSSTAARLLRRVRARSLPRL
jgi:precorrin-3B synthase